MNKKFSTLVASLLLSSAFSVYAGNAKPMLATPTQVETRATSADVEEAVEYTALNVIWGTTKYQSSVLPSFTNNARLLVIPTQSLNNYNVDGPNRFVTFDNNLSWANGQYPTTGTAGVEKFYWTYVGGQLINNAGQDFTVAGISEYFEIVPITKNGELTKYFAIATRANGGRLQYVTVNATTHEFGLTSGSNDYTTELSQAAMFCSVEAEYHSKVDANGINAEQGNGFYLSISSLIDEDATVVDSEVFAGLLAAQLPGSGVTSFQVKNAGGKFIVFDDSEPITSDGIAKVGQFKLVGSVDASKHYSFFEISKSDNGSEDVLVRMAKDNAMTGACRLYIANTRGTYALSVADETGVYSPELDAKNWAVTSLADNNFVDLKQFTNGKYVKVDFIDAKKFDNTNTYKKNGSLAILNDVADFVPSNGLYDKAPEAQWAVVATDFVGGVTLVNRENPTVGVNIGALRSTNTPNVYEVANTGDATQNLKNGDKIRITFVEEHSKTDGYAVFSENDLRNKTWYLGQTRQTADGDINVYWAENHAGSHQIGATVEEEKASKWNLSLVTKNTKIADKPYDTQVDSVLVVSTLYNWNYEKNRLDSKKDTLVILPYAFQNRSNAEFVKFNDGTNLNYYECRPYELNEVKQFAKGTWDATASEIVGADARFALKIKADGSYNYVVLSAREKADYNDKNGAVKVVNPYASKKVFQENSTLLGTWSQMNMYAKDANSLMFVTEVTAPEYRKLVTTANLDTIKLYRADNEAQVVYEKKDTKASTLLERPVSFLNIDNVEQFKDINPALYADTAYVNRGNNTRYQYLLGVNIEHKEGWYCDEHGFTATPPCKHAVPVSYNQGRYLINMIDTANILAADLKVSIHNNPFINETEEGNQCAKLAFVDAIHVLTDSVDMTKADKLYVINNEEDRTKYSVIDLSTPDFNVAKFAFKYTDSMVDDNFKIQTLYMPYDPANYAKGNANDPLKNVTEEGYLRWVNGCVVVDNAYAKGDVFNMNEDETRTPTANEEITAEGSVVVAGTNGAVVVKGAEGKSVIVSTILGKVVANEVLTSDNAQITAPAGVVVVSVDGESFKVVVK